MLTLERKIEFPLNSEGDMGFVYLNLDDLLYDQAVVFKASVYDRDGILSVRPFGPRKVPEEPLDTPDESWEVLHSIRDRLMLPSYVLRRSRVYFAVRKVRSFGKDVVHIDGMFRLKRISRREKEVVFEKY